MVLRLVELAPRILLDLGLLSSLTEKHSWQQHRWDDLEAAAAAEQQQQQQQGGRFFYPEGEGRGCEREPERRRQ